MNKIHRIIWNEISATWVAVAEVAKGHGKRSGTVGQRVDRSADADNLHLPPLKALVASLAFIGFIGFIGFTLPAPAWAQVAANQLPTGGNVVAGTAAITQNAAVLNINQTTNRAAIDWNTFNVGSAAQVNFNQPSSSSVTLNRVLDSNPSQIFGRITAPGQVFLSNPNGVVFAPGARVDVGALVATTHRISVDDFMAGKTTFDRNGSTGSVVNQGELKAALGGYIALLAPEVRNEGVIIAQAGTVALASGEVITLNFGDNGTLSGLTATQSQIAALVENKNAVLAPGGLIILSAQAMNRLQGGVINNSGRLEATGLVNDGGRILLDASDSITHTGSINVDAAPGKVGAGGTAILLASLANPDSRTDVNGSISARGGDLGGDGGFIETSASSVRIMDGAQITTLATNGHTGTWLIDPLDFTVAATGGNITGAALGTLLGSNSIQIQTATAPTGTATNLVGTTGTNGDIYVNDAVSWNANTTLTLNAFRNININQTIAASGATGKVALHYGQGAVAAGNTATYSFGLSSSGFAGKINLQPQASAAVNQFSTKLGSDGPTVGYAVVTTMADFNSTTMGGTTDKKVAIGADIAFIGTKSGSFVGGNTAGTIIDGLGHTLSNIVIQPTQSRVGVFVTNHGTLRNIGVSGLSFTGTTNYAPLGFVAENSSTGIVENISVSGTTSFVSCGSGGCAPIAATNAGIVRNFYVSGTVSFDAPTTIGGGAVGINTGTISNGANSASMTFGRLDNSNSTFGGIAGSNNNSTGSISNVTYSGAMSSTGARINTTSTQGGIGGIVGWNGTTNGSSVTGATFSGSITLGSGAYAVGGIVGYNHAAITNSTSTGTVTVGNNSLFIGGITGFSGSVNSSTPTLTTVGSHGAVVAGASSQYVGGIAGYQDGPSTTSSSASSATVTLGGTAATSASGVSSPYLGKLFGANGGTLNTTSYQIPITVSTSPTILYGATPTYSFSLISGSLSGGDSLGTIMTGTPTCTSCTNVGTYSVTKNTAASNSSYYLTWQNGSLTVAPRAINLTGSRQYDGTTALASTVFTLGNLANSETLSLSGSGAIADKHVGNGKAVTLDTLALLDGTGGSAGLASNYTFTGGTRTVNIGAAPITLTTSAVTKTYDGTTSAAGTASVSSGTLFSGDTLTGGSFAFADANAGSGNKTVNVSGVTLTDGNSGNNYTVGYASNTTSTINQAALTITAGNAPKTYGDTKSFAGTEFTSSGLVNSQTIGSVTLTSSGAAATANVNSYAIAPSAATGGTFSASNYAVTYSNGSLTVAPRAINLTGSRQYDGTTALASTVFTLGNLANSETLSLSGSGAIADKHVGNGKAVTLDTLALLDGTGGSAGLASNYTFTGGTRTVDIGAAPITLTTSAVTKTYDGTTSAAGTASVSSGTLYGSDAISGGSFAFTNANAGTGNKTVTVGGITVDDGNSGNNYTVSYADNTSSTIDQAALTITASNASVQGSQVVAESLDGGFRSTNPLLNVNSDNVISFNTSASATGGDSGDAAGAGQVGAGGISISLNLTPPGNAEVGVPGGVVTVSVPKAMATAGSGFSFELPAQVKESVGTSAIQISMADGSPLPGWIQFNPVTQLFEAGAVPDGGLPLQVMLHSGNRQVLIVISERAE